MFQPSLFKQSTNVKIAVKEDHELVLLTNLISWMEIIALAATIRSTKVKKESGPEPQYRILLGAMVLMCVKKITYRDAEDLISHYAPARYLCDLMDSDRTLDHVTLFEFMQMLEAAGVKQINDYILKIAQAHGILNAAILMSDTTAQEGMIPYPNEVGLMTRFMELISKNTKKAGRKFKCLREEVKEAFQKVKGLARNSHLFAKTREQKMKIGKKMYHTVKDIQGKILGIVASGTSATSKAEKEIERLAGVMGDLLPQILYFLSTGFVAAKKIIHLQIPEIYSINRGKIGKSVEFGLKWGISRIGSGFVQGFLIGEGKNVSDQKFCLEAIKSHLAVFGQAPDIFGFDRGGYCEPNIKNVKKMGVKHVGIAPKGKAKWAVSEKMEKWIKRERARVEGSIGTLKTPLYGFNKPNAHSKSAMVRCGHQAILGFNLRKLVRETIKIEMATA
jgi:IS5 family transposase